MSTVNLAPTADATVRGGSPYSTQNFGTANTLTVKKAQSGDATAVREAYLKFDFGDAALDDKVIVGAELQLFGLVNQSSSTIDVAGRTAAGAWYEVDAPGVTGITYANRPSADPTVLDSATVTSTSNVWHSWTVTNYARQQLAADAPGTFVMRADTASNTAVAAIFLSRESGTTSGRPKLVVTTLDRPTALSVGTATATGVPLSWTDANTVETGFRVERTSDAGATWTAVGFPAADATSFTDASAAPSTAYQYRVLATYTGTGGPLDSVASAAASVTTPAAGPVGATTPLAPTADAYVRDDTYAGTNYGSDTALQVKKVNPPGFSRKSYLKFDLSTAPSDVYSATLRVYGSTTGVGTLPLELFAHKPTTNQPTWTEAGTGSVTWSNAPGLNATPIGSARVGGTAGWHEFDVTAYVAAEKAAGRNNLTLALQAELKDLLASFSSRDTAGTTNDPQLVIATTPTPTGVGAAANSSTQVTVAWQDKASNETGYEIQRATDSGFTQDVETFTVAANATSYPDTSVGGSMTYYYRVRAVKGTQTSAWGTAPPVTTPNQAPTAVAVSSALYGTDGTLILNAYGTDDGGERNLTYSWSVYSAPSGAPSVTIFNTSTNNAAGLNSARVGAAGSYTFRVTVSDGTYSITNDTTVNVAQAITSLTMNTVGAALVYGDSVSLSATAYDQFGSVMTPQPSVTWGHSGVGGKTGSTYNAPSTGGGSAEMTASVGSVTATALFQVGQVAGHVNGDIDEDNVTDGDETGVAAYKLYLDQNYNGIKDGSETEFLTDKNGNWAIAAINPNFPSQLVRTIGAAGWQAPTFGAVAGVDEREGFVTRAPDCQVPAAQRVITFVNDSVFIPGYAGFESQTIDVKVKVTSGGADVVGADVFLVAQDAPGGGGSDRATSMPVGKPLKTDASGEATFTVRLDKPAAFGTLNLTAQLATGESAQAPLTILHIKLALDPAPANDPVLMNVKFDLNRPTVVNLPISVKTVGTTPVGVPNIKVAASVDPFNVTTLNTDSVTTDNGGAGNFQVTAKKRGIDTFKAAIVGVFDNADSFVIVGLNVIDQQ